MKFNICSTGYIYIYIYTRGDNKMVKFHVEIYIFIYILIFFFCVYIGVKIFIACSHISVVENINYQRSRNKHTHIFGCSICFNYHALMLQMDHIFKKQKICTKLCYHPYQHSHGVRRMN